MIGVDGREPCCGKPSAHRPTQINGALRISANLFARMRDAVKNVFAVPAFATAVA